MGDNLPSKASSGVFWGDVPPASVKTPAGDAVVDVLQWDEKHTSLVKTGVRDLQKEVNAAAVGVTPYEVIERAVRSGDLSLFGQDSGSVVDVSNVPDNVSEVHSQIAAGVAAQAELVAQSAEAAKAAEAVKAAEASASSKSEVK